MRFLPYILFLLSSCGSIFYQPHKNIYSAPSQYNIDYTDHFFYSKDLNKLHAWILKPNIPAKGTVIFFHGNAENISTHFFQVAWMVKFGYQIFIFDYRGYGNSEGTPDREGIFWDSQQALKESFGIHQNTHTSKQFIVYGQSLGGIIAVPALSKMKFQSKVDVLILDSTFDSYRGIAWDKMTDSWLTILFSPLTFLLISDHLSAKDYYKNLSVKKTLVIHGTKDYIVPSKFGKNIYSRIEGSKDLKLFEGEQHIQAFRTEENRQWLINYLTSH